MSKYGFEPDLLIEAFTAFNKSLESSNLTYSNLTILRDNLMEYGWKGNSSQNFYNNLANYIEQVSKLREHLNRIVELLQKAAETAKPLEEVGREQF